MLHREHVRDSTANNNLKVLLLELKWFFLCLLMVLYIVEGRGKSNLVANKTHKNNFILSQ